MHDDFAHRKYDTFTKKYTPYTYIITWYLGFDSVIALLVLWPLKLHVQLQTRKKIKIKNSKPCKLPILWRHWHLRDTNIENIKIIFMPSSISYNHDININFGWRITSAVCLMIALRLISGMMLILLIIKLYEIKAWLTVYIHYILVN